MPEEKERSFTVNPSFKTICEDDFGCALTLIGAEILPYTVDKHTWMDYITGELKDDCDNCPVKSHCAIYMRGG